MFYGHFVPAYPWWGRTPWGSPNWYIGGYSYNAGTNIYGSAIANQSVINTGSIAGFNQIASPTVIF
ncbi:hypothetical protein UFOVP116_302 [uncultured Caudovirales phage]|uniref:Uncharacterized protein n=1 Tax=uncultured Caudovirales phage TaxID=2100421 RepID=A0A6J5L825_9CAUD|nr:hypothetical protein UFOVP116_302 [uncultured Caudovirales phage]